MWTVSISSLALACVVILDITRRYLKSTGPWTSYPLPPGPHGLPFIGNVTAFNSDAPWLTYAEWAKKYGSCNAALSTLSAKVGDSRRPHVYPTPGKGYRHHKF